VDQYRVQGRGGLGIKVAKLTDERGDLVAGMIVGEDDEVLVVMERGKVVRSSVAGVPAKGRDTMGVVFAKPDAGDRVIGVALNAERTLAEDPAGDAAGDVADVADVAGDATGDADGAAADGAAADAEGGVTAEESIVTAEAATIEMAGGVTDPSAGALDGPADEPSDPDA
jgi:DNA gyrase subunit A